MGSFGSFSCLRHLANNWESGTYSSWGWESLSCTEILSHACLLCCSPRMVPPWNTCFFSQVPLGLFQKFLFCSLIFFLSWNPGETAFLFGRSFLKTVILLHKVHFFLIISNFKSYLSDFTLLQKVAMPDYHLIKTLNSPRLGLYYLFWVFYRRRHGFKIQAWSRCPWRYFSQVLCMIINILFSWFSNSLFIPCSAA